MSDILASIRKIMAQDSPSGAPAAVKSPGNGVDGVARAEMRLPTPEAPRAPAQPAAPAPAPQSSAAAAAPTPSAKPGPAPGTGAAPAARTPAPSAADEPVSLDEFLAMAAPPRDVVTTPIVPSPAVAPAKPIASSAPAPAASAAAPSDVSTPDWLFPRTRPTDDAKGDAVREPVFGEAPVASPASVAQGPSLASPRPASPSTPAPKTHTPPPNAPIAGPATTVAQAPMNARDGGPASARAAPPAPKMLGDLGSVVPGRFDSRADGTTRRIVEPSPDANDRYSPVGGAAPGPTPAAPSRAEMPRTIPAPDLEPPSEPEIPGADALRRLIAGVVPPSSLAPSAPARAPAPNADDVQTEVILPMQARAPEAVTAPNVLPRPAAPAAKHAEPAPTAKQAEAAPAAKPAAPAPVALPNEPEPAAKSLEAPPAKSIEPAAATKVAPVQAVPAPAAGSAAPTTIPAVSPATGALTTGRTLDETVVELLRPLLRDWLDTNMPRLIEPALKAELEALRGAMSKDKKD